MSVQIRRSLFAVIIAVLLSLTTISAFAQDSVSFSQTFNTRYPSRCWSADLWRNYCIVGTEYTGWYVYDVSNPNQITQTASIPNVSVGEAVFDGDNAIVRTNDQGIMVVNLTVPSQPSIIARLDTPGFAADIANKGNIVCIADRAGGMRIITTVNPEAPTEIASVPVGYCEGVAMDSRMAYAGINGGVVLVDINNPSNPFVVSTVQLPGLVRRVFAYSHYVVAAAYMAQFYIIDVANPTAPVVLSHWTTNGGGYGCDVYVQDDILYAAKGWEGVYALNIGDPAHPAIVGHYPGPFVALSVFDHNVALANYSDGFTFCRTTITPATGIAEPSTPSAFELVKNYPNPFNSTTAISFSLPAPEQVKVTVFDTQGRIVATPFHNAATAGNHQVQWNANGFAAGSYIYRVEAGKQVQSGVMQLVK